MVYHRLTPSAIPVIAAAAVLFAGTAIARADTNDDAFLQQLKNLGLDCTSSALCIQDGQNICTYLRSGNTHAAAAQNVVATSNGMSLQQAWGVVGAAQQHYCPDS
jgi:hypothetical protein